MFDFLKLTANKLLFVLFLDLVFVIIGIPLWHIPRYWFIFGGILNLFGVMALAFETLRIGEYYSARHEYGIHYTDVDFKKDGSIQYTQVKVPKQIKRILIEILIILNGFAIQISGYFVEIVNLF